MSQLFSSFNDTERLPHRKGPKTLILDLDETLLHSWENSSFLEAYQVYSDPKIYRKFHPIGSPPIAYSMFINIDGRPNRIWGLFRPHLYEFLSFAGEYFDCIIVWSAGLPQYVEEIVRQIFLESGLKPPKIVWGRNKCSNYRGLYHKPISEINAELASRHYQSFQIDPKSTLVLDDKLHTFMENPANGTLVPIFHPGKNRPNKIPTMEDLLDRSDDALLKFKRWLERPEVRNCEDVRLLDKDHIFD